MKSPQRLLKEIEKTADEASRIAAGYFQKTAPCIKQDSSYVTRADIEIEEMLRQRLPGIIKNSLVVGEETDLSKSNAEEVKKTEWVWVIDPIDGTGNYVDGLPNFCISIGLARNGWPYAGVLKFPIGGCVYSGAMDYGAFYNGTKLSLKGFRPGNNTAFYTYSESHRKFKINFKGKIRNLGTTAGHFAVTSRGAGYAVLANGSVWDYMGVAPIFLEAGGIMRYLDGTKINWPATITIAGYLPKPVLGSLPRLWKKTADMVVPES